MKKNVLVSISISLFVLIVSCLPALAAEAASANGDNKNWLNGPDDTKFWGLVISALILFVSTQIGLIISIRSQYKMLSKTFKENRTLEEEKANREYYYHFINDKRGMLLKVINSVNNACSRSTEHDRYLAATEDDWKTLREELVRISADLQNAKSISQIYFSGLTQSLEDLEVALKDFFLCVEKYLSCTDKNACDHWKERVLQLSKIIQEHNERFKVTSSMYAVKLKVDDLKSLDGAV